MRIDYCIDDYALRIQQLLSRHTIRMMDGRVTWLVTVPGKGNVDMRQVE